MCRLATASTRQGSADILQGALASANGFIKFSPEAASFHIFTVA